MSFKLGKESRKIRTPKNTPIIRKNLDKGILGEEDLPTSDRSIFFNNQSYTDKVYNKAIDDMIKDKDR